MKIAILTMFENLKPTYSLVYVVMMQVQMLLDAGHEVKLLVKEECDQSQRKGVLQDLRVEWVEITNTYQGMPIVWQDYYEEEIPWEERNNNEVRHIAKDLKEKLQDVTLCFLHDILFQAKHYLHNRALRSIQPELPKLHFIAFTHSYPFNRPAIITERIECRYTPLSHTLYAYPTKSGIEALAHQYNVAEGKCHVVYHPITLLETMSEEVKLLHSKVDILTPDVLIVYPTRLTTGKQVEKVAQLAGALCTMGDIRVRVIYCDFPAKDTSSDMYKHHIKTIGIQYGLEEADMIFTSDVGYPEGFPHSGVVELFELSNLYICPSKSESFGLTVFEAAKKGNFLVLNENVPALKEIGRHLKAYFMKWDARLMGHDIVQMHEGAEATYYGFHARQILQQLKENPIFIAKTQTRRRFNTNWIWYNQLKPLMEEVMKW